MNLTLWGAPWIWTSLHGKPPGHELPHSMGSPLDMDLTVREAPWTWSLTVGGTPWTWTSLCGELRGHGPHCIGSPLDMEPHSTGTPARIIWWALLETF